MRQVGDHVRLSAVWERPWVRAYERGRAAAAETRHDLWTFQTQC